jgi:hypothetical protein
MVALLIAVLALLAGTLTVQVYLILKVAELRVTMGVVETLLKRIDRIPLPPRPGGRTPTAT